MTGAGCRVFTIPPQADFLATLAAHMHPQGALASLLCPREAGADAADAADAPATAPFADATFASWRVYLPTRRAARALAVAMLEGAGERRAEAPRTALLPRILPLGDVDEDELLLSADMEALAKGPSVDEVLPAMPPLPRLFLLAGLMNEWAALPEAAEWQLAAHIRGHSGAAVRLARSLARLIDQFDNEELPLAKIDALLNEGPFWPERPEHRLAAQHFISFLARRYPQELERRRMQGPAQRRARLIRLHAQWLKAHPPATPVIAAGSTGTLPATAELLATIAGLPTGCVILPGLDLFMDEESWRALGPGHAQYGMKRLLERLGVSRAQVGVLHGDVCLPPEKAATIYADPSPQDARLCRQVLFSEALRPVETTHEWLHRVKDLEFQLQNGARNLHLLRAPTRRVEALSIALIMREALEHPGRTCMLVTPDRKLARAVRAELARWNVQVDDSAGQPLVDTPPGIFLRLLCEAALNEFAPPYLAALLAHPLTCMGRRRVDCARAAEDLQLAVLRPLRRFRGLASLPEAARERHMEASGADGWREHPNVRALPGERWDDLLRLAEDMARKLAPLERTFGRGVRQSARGLLRTLLEVAENIATPPGETCLLWRGETGEALGLALAEILHHAHDAPKLTPADFTAFLLSELAGRPVRPHQPTHARLRILGLLEARLLRADVMILAGLNEGIWPEEAQNDPWLNRKDREYLKLPVPERKIGLSAHDFVQAASGAQVWMTFSERVEQRPAEPSRWIVRLEALLKAAGLDKALEADAWPLRLALRLDERLAARKRDVTAREADEADEAEDLEPAALAAVAALRPAPVPPPRPMPPAHLRPRRYSASRIRTLLQNPYAIFARQILRLEKLKDLEARPTPDLFGTVVHAALEEFVRRHPRTLPDQPERALLELMVRMHEEHIGDAAHLEQVRERLARMADWFVRECERSWRDGDFERALPECEGTLKFTVGEQTCPFELTARADRIDLLANGGLRIIDYKTGNPPAKKMTSPGYDPQLDLEAAIAANGGFVSTGGARDVRVLQIVSMKGMADEGKITNWHTDALPAHRRAELALKGLERLLRAYSDQRQPWLPLLWDDGGRGYNDYDHFSRWREWLPLLAHE